MWSTEELTYVKKIFSELQYDSSTNYELSMSEKVLSNSTINQN